MALYIKDFFLFNALFYSLKLQYDFAHFKDKRWYLNQAFKTLSFTIASDYFVVKICEYVFIFVYETEVLFTYIC